MRPQTAALLVGGGAGAAALAWYVLRTPPSDDADDEEILDAGMLLLEYAKDVPGLLPVAFLVNAIVKNSAAEDEHSDAARFSKLIEALEVVLLHAANLPPPVLTRLATALEQAEGRLRAGSGAPSFATMCAELQACIDELSFEADALADVELNPQTLFRSACFADEPPDRPAEPASLVALNATIEAKRRAQAADEEQARVLEARNALLAEQVSQMQRVLDQQQPRQHLPTSSEQRLSPQQFFNYFPVPPDEAERRVGLHARRVEQLRPPLPPLDAVLRPMAERGVLGASLTGLTVTLMGEASQTVLALLCRAPDGTWVGGEQIGIGEWARIPRKLTYCQYVVASGAVECIDRDRDGAITIADDDRARLMPSLAASDRGVAETLAPGGYVAMLQEHAAKVHAGDASANPALSLAIATCSQQNHYLGAPLRTDGCVVGALCAWFTDKAGAESARARLQEQAVVVAAVIEQACDTS